jgi:hypothetical protein
MDRIRSIKKNTAYLTIWVAFSFFSSCSPPAEPTASSPAASVDRDAVLSRTERDFESAVLFRPNDNAEREAAVMRAPLLLLQNGSAGSEPPQVAYAQTETSWTFYWWGGAMSRPQAIHATLGDDLFPIAYQVFNDSDGAELWFADLEIEQQRSETLGSPLVDRRYALEPAASDAPELVIGGLYEPGPMPLGPFVYLWEGSNDVNVILCRCMAARVYDIVDSIGYELQPREAVELPQELDAWRPAAAQERLRL